MNTSTLRLAPDLVDLASLGADCFEDLMGWTGDLVGESRAELVAEGRCWKLWRAPLPGTPDESGLVTEAPKGSGTGWIRIKRFEGGGFSDVMRARLKQPRSSSFAVKEWNLLCQLRERGVPTQEPLAVGEVSVALFSPSSVLVTRELESVLPMDAWLLERANGRSRARLSRALGVFFRRFFAAGVGPLEFSPSALAVGLEDPTGESDCAFMQLMPAVEGALKFGDMPDVSVDLLSQGLGHLELSLREQLACLMAFGAQLEEVSAREGYRVLYGACLRGLPRDERRAHFRRATGLTS
jgi:hypothetical protein